MWSKKDGKITLDVSKVRSDFRVVSENGLHLVCPKKNVWDWEEHEKWLRSIVVDDNGFVVSCSWKKFGNYGEFKPDTDMLNNALANNETVRFSHKEDGSLCIRSVIDGKVIMRTRGTLFGGQSEDGSETFGEKFRRVAENKYPILLDPSFAPDVSMLFEYVAPTNTVVVYYKEEDLVFLGVIRHSDLRISPWSEIEKIAYKYKLNLVRLHELPRNPLELLDEIKEWKDEGIVARCNGERTFVKIKSAHYLASHRMKFSMNYLTMAEFIENSGVTNESELEKSLRECDYDWEIIDMAKDFYRRYRDMVRVADDALLEAKTILSVFNELWSDLYYQPDNEKKKRKIFAEIVRTRGSLVRPMAFCLYDNKTDRLHNLCRKVILTEGKSK